MSGIRAWLATLLSWSHDDDEARQDRVSASVARADRAIERHEQEQKLTQESRARMRDLETRARQRLIKRQTDPRGLFRDSHD